MYEDKKVDELRQMLIDNHGYSPETAEAIKGKSALVDELFKLNQLNEPEKTIPKYLEDGWEKYVLSLMLPSELENGNPKTAGLRRIAQRLLGEFISSGPTQVFPANNDIAPGRATVVWQIQIQWKLNVPEYIDIKTWKPEIRIFSDVADCWLGNTEPKYAAHPSSTAATRAEGRALRKALGLNTICAEEENSGVDTDAVAAKSLAEIKGETVEWSSDDHISEAQKNFITLRCRNLGIDIYKFINKSHFVEGKPVNFGSINEVSRGLATAMISELNKYQTVSSDNSESKGIPNQIKVIQ